MNKKIFLNVIFVIFINISLTIVVFSIYSNIFTQRYVNIKTEINKPRFYNISSEIFSFYERLFIDGESGIGILEQIIKEFETAQEKNLILDDLFNINSKHFDDIINNIHAKIKSKNVKKIIQVNKDNSIFVSNISIVRDEFNINSIKTEEIIKSLRQYYFKEYYNLIENLCIIQNTCFQLTNYLNKNFKKLNFYNIEILESSSSNGKYKNLFYYYLLLSTILILLNYKKFKFIDKFKNKLRKIA